MKEPAAETETQGGWYPPPRAEQGQLNRSQLPQGAAELQKEWVPAAKLRKGRLDRSRELGDRVVPKSSTCGPPMELQSWAVSVLVALIAIVTGRKGQLVRLLASKAIEEGRPTASGIANEVEEASRPRAWLGASEPAPAVP
jgi:hypothetical protein